jgi:hypothetical protein
MKRQNPTNRIDMNTRTPVGRYRASTVKTKITQ